MLKLMVQVQDKVAEHGWGEIDKDLEAADAIKARVKALRNLSGTRQRHAR